MRDWDDLPANAQTVAVVESCIDYLQKHHPYPPLMDRPGDSIMRQVHNALCYTIKDLLRPVHVRDVMINIAGEVVWGADLNQDNDSVEYAAGSGCGVGNKLDKDTSEAEQ